MYEVVVDISSGGEGNIALAEKEGAFFVCVCVGRFWSYFMKEETPRICLL